MPHEVACMTFHITLCDTQAQKAERRQAPVRAVINDMLDSIMLLGSMAGVRSVQRARRSACIAPRNMDSRSIDLIRCGSSQQWSLHMTHARWCWTKV